MSHQMTDVISLLNQAKVLANRLLLAGRERTNIAGLFTVDN